MTEPEALDDRPDPIDEAAIDAILESRTPTGDAVARDPNLRVLAAIAALHRHTPVDAVFARQQSEPALPDAIEGLTIIAPVGSGAFADVFRAHDNQLGRDVAVKMLCVTTDSGAVFDEGRLLARVRHPNVVTVYGIKRAPDGRVALEMELVDGETLAGVVSGSGALSASEVVRIGIVLCDALSAVHACGLLHRDVKAQNVMRERHTGRLVLMDFGSAHARDIHRGRHDLTGTPLYAAPELWHGGTATERSDVYSLGVLLFFLLTAAFPIAATDLEDLERRHREGHYRALLDVNPNVPAALAAVVQTAIAPEAKSRFAGADAFGTALRDLERAMQRSWGVRLRSALAAALFVLVAGALFAAGRLHATRNDREAQFIQIPSEDLGYSSSHDGRLWPFVSANGALQLFNVSSGRTREVLARPVDGVVRGAIVSPREDRVAYAVRAQDGSYRLETADLDGGLRRVVIPAQSSFEPEPVSWSRDGALLACWLRQRNGSLDLAAVPTAGEPPRVLLTRSQREEPGGSLSPDGQFVAVENWRDPDTPATELLLVPTNGSAPVSLYSDTRHPRAPLWAADNEHVFFLMDSEANPGSHDGWIVRVRDGRPDGAPSRVAVDIGTGPQIDYALTDLQELVSRLSRNTSEIYLHSMDPDRDGPAGPPARISSTAMDRHAGASYSPDGRYIAYFEINNPPAIGASARPVLAILDRTTRRSRRVPVSMAFLGYARPRWTRDSRAVSVFGRDTTDAARTGYYKIDLLTGAVTPIVFLTDWRGTHIADWGSDDDHFMYPDANRGLVERDLLTGAEVALLGPDTFAGWFAKAPDGRIAFVRRNSNPAVLEVRQRDGSLSVLLTAADGLELRAEAWSDDGKYIFFTLANAESTGSVFRIASEGGPAVDLHVRWAENPNPVAVSPDGRELAVTEVSVDHELRFLPLRLPN